MTDRDDELRALRERAYGPGADIDGDPEALIRLRELEDRARELEDRARDEAPPAEPPAETEPADDPEPDAPARVDPDPTSRDDEPEAVEEASDDPSDATEETAPATPQRRRKWMPLLWVGSVLVAALIGAAAAVTLQPMLAGRVATLDVDDNPDWPENFFGGQPDEGVVYDDFLGLTPITVPQDFGNATDGVCLYVIDDRPTQAMTTAGCAAGTFPATASLLVNADSPPDLLNRFDEGTGLQFSLEGDKVVVFADTP